MEELKMESNILEQGYRTATDYAFFCLKEWINSGILPPGSNIDQVEVSEKLNLSRVPVRMALERLAREELVQLAPHRSAVVAPLSMSELKELYFVREPLESKAVALAVDRLKKESFKRLEEILLETEEQASKGELEPYLASNREFHLSIYKCSGNAVLMQVINNLWDRCERYRRAYLQLSKYSQESIEEHWTLLELLQDRRKQQACSFLRRHNEKTVKVLVERFAEAEDKSKGEKTGS